MSEFTLHSMSVGGGSLALSQMPGLSGDYHADLDFIRDWRPSIVLTLTTRGELVDADADRLGADIRDSGARWIHFPISDFGTPSETALAQWPGIRDAVLAALNGQGRVLVHCKGGCGRAGMVALRLMVEAGEEAVPALLRLRKIRDCAIETDPQMRWAVTGLAQKEG